MPSEADSVPTPTIRVGVALGAMFATEDEVLTDCMADLARYDCDLHQELYIEDL